MRADREVLVQEIAHQAAGGVVDGEAHGAGLAQLEVDARAVAGGIRSDLTDPGVQRRGRGPADRRGACARQQREAVQHGADAADRVGLDVRELAASGCASTARNPEFGWNVVSASG